MQLDYKAFASHARDANIVPVSKVLTADLETPVSAYLKLAARRTYSFLLESVEGGEKVARYTYLGADPFLVVEASGDKVALLRNGDRRELKGNVFHILRETAAEFRPARVEGLPPFSAGAVGFVGYDAVRLIEPRIPAFDKDDLETPDAVFLFFSTLLAFDHVKHQIHVIANVRCDEWKGKLKKGYEQACRRIAKIERNLSSPLRLPRSRPPKKKVSVRSNTGKRRFCAAVKNAKEYILAGDIFQVVLSQRLNMKPEVAPFQIYRALRMVNPSPYMFYLHLDDTVILGSSPEMLVKVDGDRVEYRPIAGTRPRGSTEAEDQALAKDLLSDEKELAEHVMLVDLGRNDIGRVCEFGSVHVPEFEIIENYSHVMHIVSSVTGKLRPDRDAFDTLEACFPAGTVSGAPKVRAMEIIAELEPTRRGIYSGSVMYLDFSGNLNSCIAIRTMLVRKNRAYLQVGAGIVADSVPSKEWRETMDKAGALLKAVETARNL